MKKLVFLIVLVLVGVSISAQNLISEGFESTTFPPTGWTNSSSGCIRSTNNPRTGSANLAFNGVNDAIYTPQLSNPNQLSFWYRRSSNATAWTLNVQVSTDASTWTSIGTVTNATTTYQEFTYDLSSFSDIYVRMLDQRSTGTHERYVDDFVVTAMSGNNPPAISDVIINPSTNITSSTVVTVSATITDSDGTVEAAEVLWGTASGSRTNHVEMTNTSGSTWQADIPAQLDGTTIYYSVYALDDDADDNESTEQSYTVTDPATTTVPYSETFDSSLGECYIYTVAGIKPWFWGTTSASANGYQGSNPEEQWLVLPGINFNTQAAERMTFTSYVRYGTVDANNYLKLFYSSDYPGIGTPSGYTWNELSFTSPITGAVGSTELSAPSGVLDLSSITGTSVYLAFKYYSTNSASLWRVDNISIYQATPLITVAPSTLSGFTYVHQAGPSHEQSFTVSGADLQGNISITPPAEYEISTGTGTGFSPTNPIVLTQSGGSVAETTINVRLKAGLAIGDYNGKLITASSTSATDKTVTCSGSVTTPAAPTAPVATDATGVGSDSFTATWGAVSGAAGYYLDVYTKTAGGAATDLFISEYIEGSGADNKALEIFNGTGSSVSLEDYQLHQFNNGASTPGSYILALSTNLANNDVYVVARTNGAFSNVDLFTTSSVLQFNGDDALGLYKVSTSSYVDIFGRIGDDPGTAWTGTGGYSTADKTLVRKATVSGGVTTSPTGTGPSAFTTLTTEWDAYAQDTSTYLGTHTFSGGQSINYLTGFENKNVNNVTSYEVTGLDPETTYYYVVRAYDNYSQTSGNSNEIDVTTDAEVEEVVINADGTATGAAIVSGGSIPESLLGADSGAPAVVYTITSTGVKDVTIYKTAAFTGDWYCWLDTPGGLIAGANPIQVANFYIFEDVNFDAKGDVVVIINDNSTLPVELSSFTATLSAQNLVSLMWITQSETGVSGYYIYRGIDTNASTAQIVSPLITATNTSTTQSYVYVDSEIFETGTYYYWLQNVDIDGTTDFHGPIRLDYVAGQNNGTPNISVVTELKNVYPNPFNPIAFISYSLADNNPVAIKIYNNRGQLVRVIDNAPATAGNHRIEWNGMDNSGNACSTGLYLVRMTAGNKTFTQKVVLVK